LHQGFITAYGTKGKNHQYDTDKRENCSDGEPRTGHIFEVDSTHPYLETQHDQGSIDTETNLDLSGFEQQYDNCQQCANGSYQNYERDVSGIYSEK
jgi:hypothetical protein